MPELIDDMPAWPPGTGHLRGVTAGEILDALDGCDAYVEPALESLREEFRHNNYAANLYDGDVFKLSSTEPVLTVDHVIDSYHGHHITVVTTDGASRVLHTFRRVILVRKGVS